MLDESSKEILTKLIISLLIGLIIGGEREYRNKSAGLRTIILICLGSTIFTILSGEIGDSIGASRVAANIVTGIGFLGAGAIMREGLTVSGLTTASTIWVAAALGMAVGTGHYTLALYCMVLTFLVLTAFGYVQQSLFKMLNKTIELHLTVEKNGTPIELIEAQMNMLHLKFTRKKEFRRDGLSVYQYDIIGKESKLSAFVSFLNNLESVKNFEY